MSTITSDQAVFEAAYGSPGSEVFFTPLVVDLTRTQLLQAEQVLHPTTPGLQLVRKIVGTTDISLHTAAFDTDPWQIGSTDSTLSSKLPAVRWLYDLAIKKISDRAYLWLISPSSDPFALITTGGFWGVIPDPAETTFFFSTDVGIYSIRYDYAGSGVVPGEGDLWQGASTTWQGEAVTW